MLITWSMTLHVLIALSMTPHISFALSMTPHLLFALRRMTRAVKIKLRKKKFEGGNEKGNET